MLRAINFFTLVFCHIYESEEIKAMTIHTMLTINKRVCPSCGVEAEKSPNGQCPEDWDEEGEHDD